ncbi:hypothetical protein LDL79_03785 [Leeuwenhoekiella palythoae]|uniref:hypothetical protein n=1 Tax=Leeuwenhoekiella palythoae TaxID=573501 RepID=UPI001CE13E17|nr:hypothetical protein [Leeuwenhoekiella palythoae]UBZ11241.1 hypothetical protein LDL79_03785 [Leeuwenhoekiella palythoae]
MIRNKFVVGGVLILMIALASLVKGIDQYKLTTRNETVVVKVVDCYKQTNYRSRYFLKFKYDNQIYTKRIKGVQFQNLKKVDSLKLLTNRERNEFIFVDELKRDNGFVYSFIFFVAGVIIIRYGYILRRKND